MPRRNRDKTLLSGLCSALALLVAVIIMAESNLALAESLQIEHPTKYAIYQRVGDQGDILISGMYTGNVRNIEARFGDGEWRPICSNPKDGRFAGSLAAPVGQAALTVRVKESPAVADSVELVAVGDVYVIAGQSNAAGWADPKYQYNTLDGVPYELSMFRRNVSANWEKLQHPTSASRLGSPWPYAMSYLSKEHRVPVGIITTAISGAWLKDWMKSSGQHYPGMIDTVKRATRGTMRVRAVLWFQGEADCNPAAQYAEKSYNGSYDKYLNSLKLLVRDMHRDLTLDTVYAGQIGNVPHRLGSGRLSTRRNIYYIRKALQDAWRDPLISPGPVVYDVALATDSLHIHFSSPEEMTPLAKRWAAAISQHTYQKGIGRGPILQRAEFAVPGKSVKLTFDKELRGSDYKGQVGQKAEGWFFEQGFHAFTDKDIASTKIEGKTVYVEFRVDVPVPLFASYGIDHDGDGKKILRGPNDLPAEPFYTVLVSGGRK